MGKKKRRKGTDASTIVQNKKARHDYFIEDSFEAGLALEGWEVKSLRDGRAQLREAYVILKDGVAESPDLVAELRGQVSGGDPS